MFKFVDPGADGPVDSLCYPFYIKNNVESCSSDDGCEERLEITEGPTLINNWD